MLAIAEKIVEQQAGDFDPAEFVDRYEDALRAMIEEKKKGHVVKAPQPSNDDGKVIDLMAALKRSLKGGGGEAQQQEAPRRRGSAKRASPKPRPKGTRSVA
jgi:DNA end-binding protein Ku